MREEMLEKRLHRAQQKVQILEKMIEESTRKLFLSKERFREQSEFLRNIIESLTHPFYVVNADDYTIKMANSATRAGDLSKGIRCYELMYKRKGPCEASETPCPLEGVKKARGPVKVEHLYRGEDGEERVLEVYGYPLFDRKGKVVQIIGYSLDITARKKAEEKIKRHLDRLSALRSIDIAICSSLDLRITLGIVLDKVMDQLMVDAACILRYRPHLQTLEFTAGCGFNTGALQYTCLKIGESYAGRAALERTLVHIPDLREDRGELNHSSHFDDEGFISYHSVPLIAKGSVRGVIEVFHRSPVNPDHEWVDFLEALAGQAAIAIDSFQMFERLERAHIDLVTAYDETIEGWSRALDLRDKETEGHSQRVTEWTLRIADAMGVSEAEQANMRRGALLHDIGKMGIPDHILLKPGPLNESEWETMKRHPELGYKLLSPIEFLRPALDIPYCHHEKWDGTGYPRGLKGKQIPLSARIFAVVDIYDALTSERPYRPAWPKQKVLDYIRSLAGTHLDPKVVETFLKLEKEWKG